MSALADVPEPDEVATDVISLSIPASVRFVRLVRIGAASLARRKGVSVRAIDDLRLAVDEAFGLLLADTDHEGSVDITFEIDDHELVVVAQQRIKGPHRPYDDDALTRFEVIMADLVDRFSADPVAGVVQFSKTF